MKKAKNIFGCVILMSLSSALAQANDTNIVIADFEGANYGQWQVSGSAFGDAPAHGTLPNQMSVEGFQGHGLANSYHGGDGATGKLTSPTFKIQRKYIQFLIGGGGWEGKTCLNLLVNGKVVRTATGPNVDPGGSERLQPAQWDVSELLGQDAVLEIVDNATGGWGHINVDQIVQSDQRINAPITRYNVTRELNIDQPYLNFPVKDGGPKRQVTVSVNGQAVRSFDIELADGKPDWWAFLDATPFKGQTVTIQVNKLPEGSTGLSSIDQSAEIKDSAGLYHETMRPQFHFTSRRGWLNDPNGLVFYQGEYHLFYQHNPYGWNWGNMSWGHAVSKDLVHWHELPVALYPDKHGTMYSGSAVVDWKNTGGFQTGTDPALVAMVTAAGNPFTQEIAFSNDRGRTWSKYQDNPVLGHIAAENRDPKVIWYAPEKKWVMSLYLDHNDYEIFESHDLKHWSKLQDFKLQGDAECPNFFEIPLDGDTNNPRWVFFGASGVYVVGKFDGQKFTPETQPRHMENGNCWYAAQVYSDIPPSDGRTILVPWGRLPNGDIFKGMPFNQMMGLPVELTLHSTAAGEVIKIKPVRELQSLRSTTHNIESQTLKPGENVLANIHGDLFEIEARIALGDAKRLMFNLRGLPVMYDAVTHKLSCLGHDSTMLPEAGEIYLHVFVDRASVDIYGGDGTLYMPMAQALSPKDQDLKLSCAGGNAKIVSLKVYELKSAWE